MKKLLTVTLLLLFTFTLTSCKGEEVVLPTGYDIPEEGTVIKNNLPYYDFFRLNNPVITITVKDMGDIVIELFPEQAPNTVANFIAYAERGDYVDNTFHRVMVDFMIQGGRLTSPSCTIQGEMNNNPLFTGDNSISHNRGVISMARVGGNYDSGSSQFFIVHADSLFLDDEYASFGGVISGFNILDFIANMNDGVSQVTYEPVYIENITVELNGYTAPTTVCE